MEFQTGFKKQNGRALDMLIQPIVDPMVNAPCGSQAKKSQPSVFKDVLARSTAKVVPENGPYHSEPKAGSLPSNQLVNIGTITSKNPTVSNLLIGHSTYNKECWRIIHAAPNRNKPYTKIQAGTTIYYDPKTKELLWGDMITSEPAEFCQSLAGRTPAPTPENAPLSDDVTAGNTPTSPRLQPGMTPDINESLVAAIEPMIGKTYSDVDCFELLVSGLSNLGFTYTGKNGLGRKLINMALDRGLPMNAYLNGEGLVKLSGNHVYARSFMQVHHPASQASRTIEELQPYLKKGAILSFSTESRGHTGVISNRNGAWTYINSGVMDNTLGGGPLSKGVGEEDLNKEIYNWFNLAATRKESLTITVGQLNEEKLALFYKPEKSKIS